MENKKKSFFYNNSLSIVFVIFTLLALTGQYITGWHEYNEFLQEHDQPSIALSQYVRSGHFLQATFENWESEFFQMALFVILTIFLRQKGSSESKKLDGEEEVDEEPKDHPGAPWPVKKGGFMLKIYKHSLSIALLLLFILSFAMHWYGSWKDYNLNQTLDGKSPVAMINYLGISRFWFESFQNWQSEFLSIFAIVFLSIYLRQIGSSQSKKVDAPYDETRE
ncbi:MAG: hypothetical protein H0V65_01235 [Chitinophagales bacterium]|nr:hypothetical protein [Chitinophagales bacterium]